MVMGVVAVCLGGGSLLAQVPLKLPTDHAGIVVQQDLQMKEEIAYRKMPAAKDAGEELDRLPKVIAEHSLFFESRGGIYNGADEFERYIEKAHPEPKVMAGKLEAVQAALKAAVPSFYVGTFDTELARIYLKEDFDLAVAQALAEAGIGLYAQADCLEGDRYEAESQHVYDEKRAKHPVPFTYHAEEGEEHCAKKVAADYATLGKIEAKRGDVAGATAEFGKALAAHPNATAALGLAAIDAAKGDEAGELAMDNVAMLTGAVSADEVKAARGLYAKLNPGTSAGSYDEVLDKLYAPTFVNPVVGKEIEMAGGTPQHVVLEELFTGADCEPCVAPDLASEALLEHTPRSEVVVAVYHDNAPGPDPLTTTVSGKRGEYYGTGGSTPHVFLDGKELEIEEGPPSHAQSSFDILTKAIAPLLAVPSVATLEMTAERKGKVVEVAVKGAGKGLLGKTHLQILLLETEISDSGKNTLRFQPMVVRAAAKIGADELGMAVDGGKDFSKSYAFDLEKVEADNLAYYDEYREGFEKRMAPFISKGYMTLVSVDERAKFREAKNQVHPERLVVVAFLQRDDTKSVLQTSYAVVSAAEDGGK
jgi:hypothetical protein